MRLGTPSPPEPQLSNLGGHVTHRLPQGSWQDAQAVVPAKHNQTVSSVKGEPQHLCPVRTGAATSSHKQAPPRLTGVRGWGGNRAAGPAPAQPGAAAGALRHPAKGCRPGAPQRVLGVCVVRAAGYVSPGIWVSRHRGPGGATSLWHVYLGWPSDPSRLQTHSAACGGRSMVRILTHSP